MTALGNTYFNKTEYNFDCGWFDSCEYFSSMDDCMSKFQASPTVQCFDDVSSKILEYVKTCTQEHYTQCHNRPNVLYFLNHRGPMAYSHVCHTKPYIHCSESKTGKTSEGPKIAASKEKFWDKGSTQFLLYGLAAIILIGSITERASTKAYRKATGNNY